jgi:uncharacterized protein YukE
MDNEQKASLKISMTGTFDVENYGDLMFPIIAEKELQKRLNRPLEMNLFSYRQKSKDHWPFDVKPFSQFEKTIQSSDALIIGGGHLIRFDKFVATHYFPTDSITHHPTGYWLAPPLVAKMYNVPTIWNGPSSSSNTPNYAKPFVCRAFDQSDYVAVRDNLTASELKQVGYDGECHVIPDTVFNISNLLTRTETAVIAEELLKEAGIVGPYVIAQTHPSIVPLVQQFLQSPFADQYQVLCIPIGPILGDFNSLITKSCPDVKILSTWPTPLQIASLIAESSGSIAMSLHLTITSLAYGLPVLRPLTNVLDKYKVIESLETVFFMNSAGKIPHVYLDHLGKRSFCKYVQETQQRLDEHWDAVAQVILKHHARNEQTHQTLGDVSSPSQKIEKVWESAMEMTHQTWFAIWNKAIATAETQKH